MVIQFSHCITVTKIQLSVQLPNILPVIFPVYTIHRLLQYTIVLALPIIVPPTHPFLILQLKVLVPLKFRCIHSLD